MHTDPAVILALISSLGQQLAETQAENARLREEVAQLRQPSAESH